MKSIGRMLPVLLLAALLGILALPVAAQDMDYSKLEAPNCDYGGLLRSIKMVDQYTVKMSLCSASPAFPQVIAHSSFAIHPFHPFHAPPSDRRRNTDPGRHP